MKQTDNQILHYYTGSQKTKVVLTTKKIKTIEGLMSARMYYTIQINKENLDGL